MNESDKIKVTKKILIVMEKACRLKAKTGFEQNILEDRLNAIKNFSMKAVVSKKQLGVLSDMAKRYDAIYV